MLPILKLANLYSEDKIRTKYPCYDSKESILIENLFYEYLGNIRFINGFYDILSEHYYEANEILFAWQDQDDVPRISNSLQSYLSKGITLEENIYWKSPCDSETSSSILSDLIPLWSSLLAHKIANEDIDSSSFQTFLDDMYAFMKSRENEVIKYPYKLKFTDTAQASDSYESNDSSENYTEDTLDAKNSSKRNYLPLIIIGILLAAGIWFFRSGTYTRLQNPDDNSQSVESNFYNLVVDSSEGITYIQSTLVDTELTIQPSAQALFYQLYKHDSIMLSDLDTLKEGTNLFALPLLDSRLYYQIDMSPNNQINFDKKFPELVYVYIPLAEYSNLITIKLKHTPQ